MFHKMNFRDLLGKKEWDKLHPEIKARFSSGSNQAVVYKGVMSLVHLSATGKILAQLCRLIGTPLALYSGKNVPMEVKVYPNRKLKGITWDRSYYYSSGTVNRVKSTKCIQEGIGLVEMVGFGFGMDLDVYQKGGALFFESNRFFLQIDNYKVPIPDLLSPGKTIVSQRALEGNKFEFRLEVNHSILGRLFKQIGIFEET